MVAFDLWPTLITRQISDDIPLTAKKSTCVEDATKKCQISDMQGVRFWAQFLLSKALAQPLMGNQIH